MLWLVPWGDSFLAPAASGAAASASEILPPPVNQAGQPKHPTEMGAARLRGLHLELLVRAELVQQLRQQQLASLSSSLSPAFHLQSYGCMPLRSPMGGLVGQHYQAKVACWANEIH
jgi:hypothetical protein